MTHPCITGESLSDPLGCHSVTHPCRVSAGQEIGPLYLFSTTRNPTDHRNPRSVSPMASDSRAHTPARKDTPKTTETRALCRHCEASPAGCQTVQVLSGRTCCQPCPGHHEVNG